MPVVPCVLRAGSAPRSRFQQHKAPAAISAGSDVLPTGRTSPLQSAAQQPELAAAPPLPLMTPSPQSPGGARLHTASRLSVASESQADLN